MVKGLLELGNRLLSLCFIKFVSGSGAQPRYRSPSQVGGASQVIEIRALSQALKLASRGSSPAGQDRPPPVVGRLKREGLENLLTYSWACLGGAKELQELQ